MPRKKDTLTLSVPPGTKEQLESIARRLGIFWGKSPSPSGLVAAIAQQQVQVGRKSFTLDQKQVEALQQAAKALIDAGHVEEARTVNTLLLNQGDSEAPLRQALLQQLNQSIQAWRDRIDQLIADRQCFHLKYRNAQSQELEYTVRYAEVRFYEKRFYLQIWCEETEEAERDTPDLREIWHNRCLRFDRILHIEPFPGVWKGELDSLKVYLHFYRGLANAYEPKPEDEENVVLGDIRQVVRRVVNPFWLVREVLRYGKDCQVIAPDGVRERVKQEIRQLCQSYNMEIAD
ncbi:helix-turn-helix transcriptional regulator [Floridanema evergladense]|uniref:Helix-turn-helix transcriptional regulator n=1 Tax=Floridaenema evergladense BLCC-F167 TaxID=3153639 RepID=A0ABV4WIN1_9CYAN